ncbi:UNVERIFIED_CONTAM: hypothetical protein GTU68_010140 [Idotea baltica]|nr:hypothetical protein [Idotea baltica]
MINNPVFINNSFNIDATCDRLFDISDTGQLQNIDYDRYLFLGGSSNVLFTEHFKGSIIRNAIRGIQIIETTDDHVVVEVGGGEVWHDVVMWAVAKNFGGIQNLSLIPGSTGAAPIQNIGAYGAEVADVILSVKGYNVSTGRMVTLSSEECEFGYRSSIFKTELRNRFFITHVLMKLTRRRHRIDLSYGAIEQEYLDDRSNRTDVQKVSKAVIRIRQSKLPDPNKLGNCGSFFKNPVISKYQADLIADDYDDLKTYPINNDTVKVPAAWLIEKCGFKGKRVGDVGTYHKHALVIVNYGGSTGSEVWDFAQEIIDGVKNKFRIELVPEVNIL